MNPNRATLLRVFAALVAVFIFTGGVHQLRSGVSAAPDFSCTLNATDEVSIAVDKGETGSDIALKLYEAGSITEHSIGFNIIQARNESNYQSIQEVRLWEGSSVLWGANERTPTTGIKSEEFAVKTNLLNDLMHNGTLSDETFEMIEKMLKDIQAIYKATGTPEAPKEPEVIPAAGTPEAQLIKFYKQIYQFHY